MSCGYTSRMAALLAAMRRERNGAVADAMRCYGRPCGLNYGVSLPTVRQIARSEPPEHDFACYLWQQDIRELKLAALHLAEPERLVPAEFARWEDGLVNSELAEEAAFALLPLATHFTSLFEVWLSGENSLARYAALMAASRRVAPEVAWVVPAVEAVRCAALHAAGEVSLPETLKNLDAASDSRAVSPAQAARLTAQGAVALLAAVGSQNEENRRTVLRAASSLGKLPAEDFVHEELAWRL